MNDQNERPRRVRAANGWGDVNFARMLRVRGYKIIELADGQVGDPPLSTTIAVRTLAAVDTSGRP